MPKRIAYIHGQPLPSRAANTFQVAKMCQALVQEGYPTELFAPANSVASLSPQDFRRHYGLETGYPVHLFRSWLVTRGYDFILRTLWYVKRGQFDLVFSRHLAAAMWTAQIGIPTLYEGHVLPGKRLGSVYFRRLARQTAFQGLIVISPVLGKYYRDRFADCLTPERLIVEPDGVDLERFTPVADRVAARQRLRLPSGFVAGYTGHLYPGRGIALITELAQRLPETTFILVGGEDADIAYWQGETRRKGIGNLRFTGFVPNSQIPFYLAACDALLMPYQHWVPIIGMPAGTYSSHQWMSPIKLFEYMAAQRPIIASDLPALRNFLGEDNAVLCPPDVPKAWEIALRKLQTHPERAQSRARQARQDVVHYTWRARVRRILAQLDG